MGVVKTAVYLYPFKPMSFFQETVRDILWLILSIKGSCQICDLFFLYIFNPTYYPVVNSLIQWIFALGKSGKERVGFSFICFWFCTKYNQSEIYISHRIFIKFEKMKKKKLFWLLNPKNRENLPVNLFVILCLSVA